MVRLFEIASVVLVCFLACTSAREGFGPGDQDYGFVNVRKGAHIFYWLYYTTANVSAYTDRPLAIWLQGGPGASSTGYGNFEELGPLTLDLKARNHTWVKDMNVLFIDNPVGSGFSYVDSVLYLTRNNKQIALDLVSFMKGFYALHPAFKKVPLHIFCESYGGKMAPEFALELHNAIQKNEIESNLKSVALGDPWVSPVDSVNAWAPLLLNMGIVDQDGYDNIMNSAKQTEKAVNDGKYTESTMFWGSTQTVLLNESKGVDFYNILLPTNGERYSRSLMSNEDRMYRTLVKFDIDENRDQILSDLMRGPVSKALGIPSNVVWGSQSGSTFTFLSGDFMKPVVDIVETLLNSTNLEVAVFSGQLDLICATPGTVNWINGMKWINKTVYEAAPRRGIVINRILEGYQKVAGNFAMFWVERAGHMVPSDNPRAMDFILKKYTNYDVNKPVVTEKPEVTGTPNITWTPVVTITPNVTWSAGVTTTPNVAWTPGVTTTRNVTWTPGVTTTRNVTWTPGVTTTPNVTWTAGVTTTPNVTWTPGVTTTRNVTWTAGVTRTPNVTWTPGVTTAPNVTWTPGVTRTPNVTWTAGVTTTRNVTWTPGVTRTPNVTWTPGVTTAPNVAWTPGVTRTPNVTWTPGVTTAPNVTWTPGVTRTPNVTWTPGVTTTPNVTWTPGVTTTSNVTWTPGVTTTPNVTRTPGVTTTSNVTRTPGVTTTTPKGTTEAI